MPATYDIRIDWDAGEPEYVPNTSFEVAVAPWTAGGVNPPTVTRSTTRAYVGVASMLITWATATMANAPRASVSLAGLTTGAQYTAEAWVWVPTGSPDVYLIGGSSSGTASTLKERWEQITVTWSATAATDSVQVRAETDVTSGQQAWVDEVHVHPGSAVLKEDVTSRTLERTPLQIDYGRDQARSLSPSQPGRAMLELDNTSRDYSPENTSSTLVSYLGPGRPLIIRANLGSTNYVLYRGFLDEFTIKPSTGERSVAFTALDALARLQQIVIATAIYPAVRSGEAIGRILDAAGWSASERDIDPGGSTLRWWWEDGVDAYAALLKVIAAEGPDSFFGIGTDGEFVFRDRHHRLVRSASTTVQATFRDTGTEPLFSAPFEYDIGWRDIANVVQQRVTDTAPGALVTVWEDASVFSIAPGQTRSFAIVFQDAVWSVRAPTQGVLGNDPDIVNPTSNTATASFSRTSGKSLQLDLSVAPSASGSAQISRVRLRGYPLATVRELNVNAEDSTSVTKNGRHVYNSGDTTWLNRNDGAAIADIVLSKRATRLPIAHMQVVGGSDTQLTQQLSRDVSDRVRIIEPELGLDADFYIEQIKHRIGSAGKYHVTSFGCEKIPSQPSSVFTFDVTGRGFNDGRFGATGLDDPSQVWIWDHATQSKFDVGLLGN